MLEFNRGKEKSVLSEDVKKDRSKKILELLGDYTYEDWEVLKSIIDKRFIEINQKSTFSVSKNTLKHIEHFTK